MTPDPEGRRPGDGQPIPRRCEECDGVTWCAACREAFLEYRHTLRALAAPDPQAAVGALARERRHEPCPD